MMMAAISLIAVVHTMLLGIVLIHLGEQNTAFDWAISLAFLLWNSSPIIISYIIARAKAHFEFRWAMLAFQIGISIFYTVEIYGAFYVHPDAQAGLIFLFLPVVGLGALVPISLICAFIIRTRASVR